jgi:uncharacterized BrkB/YihY/UPF0761 family membrane protein
MLDTNWLKLYEAAILEINPAKLAICIGAAEQAITQRESLWDTTELERRKLLLKVVLVLVGLLFSAGIYPLMTTVRSAWQANNEDATPMMLSLYVTLGISLLLAAVTHRRIAA